MEYSIDGHTVEIESSGSGSLDPWTSEYASSLNVNLMCTADLATFILVDDDHIYRLKYYGKNRFNEAMKTMKPGAFEEWLEENCDDFGSLRKSKEVIDQMKKRHDEFEAMTTEEKEEQRRKWREEARKRREEQSKKKKSI